MNLWQRVKAAFSGEIVTKDDLQKALDTQAEASRRRLLPAPTVRHEGLYTRYSEPGGYGPRKTRGYSTEFLRMWVRQSPFLRAVVDIRTREIASAQWDIVPNLENEQAELEWLEKLIQGVHRFPDMAHKLDTFEALYLDPENVRHLIEITRHEGVSTAEASYRCSLVMQEMQELARRHAAPVKALLKNPGPDYSWKDILRRLVPDILTIDSGCIEKRRTQYPVDERYPGMSLPRPENRILTLAPVDGATLRPCLDEFGRFRDSLDPPGFAYEQWINSDKVPGGDFRRCDMLRIVENPQSDITWRGYGFSRVETLVLTSMLDAMSDKADMEEYQREWYHGILNIKDTSFQMEDAASLRQHIMENWEGSKGVPVTAFNEAEYLSMAPGGSTRDNRSQARRDLYLNRICAIFEIGKTKLGNYDNANYSTSENSKEHTDDGLDHLIDTIDDAITRDIVQDSGLGGHTDIRYVSRPQHGRDEEREQERMEKDAKLGILDINDMRLAKGKAPIDEGNRSIFYFEELERAAGKAQGGQAAAGAGQEGANAMNTDADEEQFDENEQGNPFGSDKPDDDPFDQ